MKILKTGNLFYDFHQREMRNGYRCKDSHSINSCNRHVKVKVFFTINEKTFFSNTDVESSDETRNSCNQRMIIFRIDNY